MNATDLKSHTAVSVLAEGLSAITQQGDAARTSPVDELYSRLEYLEWVFDQTDATLISKAELDGLAPHAQNLRSHFGSLPSNPTAQSTAANAQLDLYYARFPYPRFKKIPRSESQRIIDDVQNQADGATSQIRESAESLKHQLDELRNAVDGQAEALDKISRQNAAVEEKYNSTLNDVNALADRTSATLESKIDERLAEANSRLGKAIDDFQSNATENRSKASALLAEMAVERKTVVEAAERELRDNVNSVLSEGDEYIRKIRDIYGIAGGDASAGQLVKSATSESVAYKILGALAFIAFSAGSVFAYIAIQPALLQGSGWETLASRAGLVLASYIPAWFLASLAMKHRKAELAFRSLAVRVATFDPYLSEFASDERIALKKQMAEMFFSSDLQSEKTRDLGLRDLRDFEKLISPFESIIERFRAIITRTQ